MSTSFARSALVGGAVILVVAGCGSHKKHLVSGPPSVCEIRAETAAEAAVVKKAYDAGQLGTAKQLAKHFAGDPTSSYLNPDGTLKPLSQLNGNTRFDFEAWLNEDVAGLRNDVGDRVRAAGALVRQSSISTGKPCRQVIAE